uniref:Secreted protein n=1 Tax=Panstrongylus lignarius TaxID=156445 RepID=A0A224XQ91_9HEMI
MCQLNMSFCIHAICVLYDVISMVEADGNTSAEVDKCSCRGKDGVLKRIPVKICFHSHSKIGCERQGAAKRRFGKGVPRKKMFWADVRKKPKGKNSSRLSPRKSSTGII